MPVGPVRGHLPSVAGRKQKLADLSPDSSRYVARRFNNLPIPLTGLVGRRQELAKVRALLAGTSLLTLTGVGGSGKTRLALALATEVAQEFTEGVCWVDLAGLLDGSLLWSAVAEGLGTQDTPGESLDQVLIDLLASKNVLLILDNCEHLIYASAKLAERLLSTCPHLKLLITSREPLGLTGEVVWSVPVLSLPAPPFALPKLMQYDAPRLFITRARSVNSDFVLAEHNAEAVGQICARLDGIPLAIELAAARVKALSVEQIAARLQDRFELLTVGSRTALPRQQTLRSTIDWSFDLLTEAERVLFRRLAVFAGGFTIEAAAHICADRDGRSHVSSHNILDLMTHLVDKSLVVVQQDHEARYGMLETIRQYALEKLEQAQELATMSERHFEYSLTVASEAKPQLISEEQKAALARLDAEHDNLNKALEWSLASDNPEQALRLATALGHFWRIRGHLAEGRNWLDKALRRTEYLGRTVERSRGLTALGGLTWYQGDSTLARTELEEAAAIAEECADTLCRAEALSVLGHLLTDQGYPDQARELLEKSVETFLEGGDRWNYAQALMYLGRLHLDLGDVVQAQSLLESSLKIFRELGDRWGMLVPIGSLGFIAERRGDAATARRLLEERLHLAQELGSRQQIVFALYWLGVSAYITSQFQEAGLYFKQSLELSWQTGLMGNVMGALEALGWVARENNQPARAARLMGAAAVLLAHRDLNPVDKAEHERNLAALHAEMSEQDFNGAWAEGEAMTWEQAVEYARQVQAPPSEGRLTPRQAAKQQFGGLSGREREVALLIAEGKSNRQIAESLVISERTVTTHVANILSKLGFNSRSQVASWAVEKGLRKKQSKV